MTSAGTIDKYPAVHAKGKKPVIRLFYLFINILKYFLNKYVNARTREYSKIGTACDKATL